MAKPHCDLARAVPGARFAYPIRIGAPASAVDVIGVGTTVVRHGGNQHAVAIDVDVSCGDPIPEEVHRLQAVHFVTTRVQRDLPWRSCRCSRCCRRSCGSWARSDSRCRRCCSCCCWCGCSRCRGCGRWSRCSARRQRVALRASSRITRAVAEVLIKCTAVLLHTGCGAAVARIHLTVDDVEACLPLIQPQLEVGTGNCSNQVTVRFGGG